MCIIACQKQNAKKLDKDTFYECGKYNKDGFGLMYVKNGKLVVQKTVCKDTFWNIYNDVYDDNIKNTPIVLHFRLGTSGEKGILSCHPFTITNDIAVVHNGVITGYGDKLRSDTREFVEDILTPIALEDKKFLENEVIYDMIKTAIGSDKMCFLDVNKNITFINESSGNWQGDTWFSNYGYKVYRYDSRNTQKSQKRLPFKHTTKKRPNKHICLSCREEVNPLDADVVKVVLNGNTSYICGNGCAQYYFDGLLEFKDEVFYYQSGK